MSFFEVLVNGAFTGIAVGFGTAIGTYFSTRLVVHRIENLERKLKGGQRRGEAND